MGATAAVHPADPILQAYGLGKLDDASSASVSEHLEGCDSCQRRVAELSSDEFLGRLQQAKVKPDRAASGWSSAATSSSEGTPGPVVAPPAAETLSPELVDHPDYEIVRELGRGGMGVVYLANNKLMGRLEVLKVVGRHLIERPGVADRFLREIRSAANLHHTNIVAAYSAMRLGQSLVLAMEYVEGLDLAAMVKTKGPLPVAHASYFIHQAALGLQHAHERGMVHRDIKPANLILSRDGKKAIVKVLDFGLAKVTSEGETDSNLTGEGQMLGTPDYIAPEQIRDAQSADIRADIYSLGCTLYYLLTGSPPFRRERLYDVYEAHVSAVATPLNLVRPEVPVELGAVVAKMMAKEPGRRFQTPGDVARTLMPFFKPAATRLTAVNPEVSQLATTAAPIPTPRVGVAPTQLATILAPAPAPPAKEPAARAERETRWESLIEFKETEPLREPAPAVKKTAAQKPRWLRPAAAAGVLLMALIAAFAAWQLRVKTASGTIVIENPADSHTQPAPDVAPPKTDRSQFKILAGKWSRTGNELVQMDASKWSSALTFGDDQWTDYDFTVDLMKQGGKGGVGLCFRSADGNESYVGFSVFEDKDCDATDHNHGFEHWLESATVRIVSRKWYTAHVNVRGDHFACSLYDKESGRDSRLPDFTDRRHPRGRVGLQTIGSTVRFKNIKVTSPDGKVLWEGPPAVDSRPDDGFDSWSKVPQPSAADTVVRTPSSQEPITNSIGMTLKLIPAGEFMMGSHDDDGRSMHDEKPQHRVRITRPFYLGVHEVTQAQYEAVMGDNPSYFSANGGGKAKVAGQSTDRHPVDSVSWLDAVKFCNKLSEKEGLKPFYEINGDKVRVLDWSESGYRLPTEAEWEYACRANAPTTTRYSFDDDAASLGEFAWYDRNSGNRTHPVGEKHPNGFGVFDMLGNVWEWCWDGYGDYKESRVDDPASVDGAGIFAPENHSRRHACRPDNVRRPPPLSKACPDSTVIPADRRVGPAMKDNSNRLSVAEQIRKGLEEAIRHAKGEITLKTTTLEMPDRPPELGGDQQFREKGFSNHGPHRNKS